MASVAYNHVTKRYGPEALVVKDLNLQVLDTEFMVLVGPSRRLHLFDVETERAVL